MGWRLGSLKGSESKGSPGGSEVREVMGGLVGRGWEGLQGLCSVGQRLFVN